MQEKLLEQAIHKREINVTNKIKISSSVLIGKTIPNNTGEKK